jgi:hypothetical protein
MPPGKTFKGLSYGDWVAIWSNWLISRDVDSYDGEDMLFLRGYVGYKAVSDDEGAMRYQDPDSVLNRTGDKKLNILKGTSVFVPATASIKSIGDLFEGQVIENEEDLRKVVNDDISDITSIWARVKLNHSKESVKLVPNLQSYRIETPVFKLTVPEDSALNNRFDDPMKPGVYDTVVGGYFILLPDLAPSTYQIDFGCEGPGDYSTRGLYDIEVYRDTRKEPSDIS